MFKSFVVRPSLDSVRCQHGRNQACEVPLPLCVTHPADPVECTLHSKASKSVFVCLGFNYLKLYTMKLCVCVCILLSYKCPFL